MVNRFLPHIFILPEDDANRQVANGFVLDFATRQIQVLSPAGGWFRLRERFVSDHVGPLQTYEQRLVVLLSDFDGNMNRPQAFHAVIPGNLTDRVFILGTFTEPEGLRHAGLGSYETIGRALAQDCRQGTHKIWGHELLRHNAGELDRLRERCLTVLP